MCYLCPYKLWVQIICTHMLLLWICLWITHFAKTETVCLIPKILCIFNIRYIIVLNFFVFFVFCVFFSFNIAWYLVLTFYHLEELCTSHNHFTLRINLTFLLAKFLFMIVENVQLFGRNDSLTILCDILKMAIYYN